MRTVVYIDGFNLYYRALKGTRHKWLDIVALSRAALPATCNVIRVNYYTARVSGRTNPDSPKRQHAYLRALATLPEVAVHYGNFMMSNKWAGLVQPPNFKPPFVLPAGAAPNVAHVWKTEEKGSDVNLGVHLVRDACMGVFDLAAVLTNDTDLLEPIRIVRQELNLPVTLAHARWQACRVADAGGFRGAAYQAVSRAVPVSRSDPGSRTSPPIVKPAGW